MKNILSITRKADSDLSSSQYLAVKLTADNGVALAGAGDDVVGVLTNDPASGQAAAIAVIGTTRVVSGAAFSVGDYLKSDASGKAITAGADENSFAQALEAAGGADEQVEVLLLRGVSTSLPAAQELSETFDFDDFTDNTDATGFVDFVGTLPEGAVVLGWKADATAGFAGDTSAAIQVGIAGDLDRFSADTTGDIFTTGDKVGSLPVAADAAKGIAAAVSPRVTVTGAADFTAIDAGTVIVSIYYLETQ